MNLVEADRLADKLLYARPERQMFESIREHRIALLTWERIRGQILIFVSTNMNPEEMETFNHRNWLRRAGG